ncbi:amidase family protein [Candidatus Nanohalobium constans]|uniref:Glutamyl-tRNA(Gln) amidotransferase subunit A n=1 Tax=Candidatus Nanohalobium constans TaxID=2565781 RepID=A0A5Q0UFV2_9ARCH|nr:amidase family protein [Candidatus Nanohalobium constans]QGA80476.1 aspartyl-tRNA(Asn)/glutamyl-tRNA(Gln) amidotransferase subunit A [Candidatus Nanohalobium constans]
MNLREVVEGEKQVDHEEFLSELKEKNQELNFMREITQESNTGELNGIPFIAKDAICTEDTTTSAGSQILENYQPVFDATVIERLKESGASFYGKTQQDEFGFGTFSTNCAFGTPKNPHDKERVVGGSSGGAGAVVAAMDKPLISLGESTGGSITNPAAYNGVVGITPTYGRVSRYGLVDYANSLDKIGVLARTVYGTAKGLEIIAGEDENDQTTSSKEVPNYSENLDETEGRVAVPKQYLELDGVEEGVMENFQDSIDELKQRGFEVEEVDMPLLSADIAVPAYYVLAMSEASTNLAKMSGMRYGMEKDPEDFEDFNEYFSEVRSEGFGEEAKRRILLGTYTRQAGYRDQYYIKAAKVRTKIINQYKEVFEEFDAVISPSMPNIAPKIEEAEDMSPSEIYAMDTLTVGPNLAGMPMISVPNGKSEGMPTGLHIVGDHFNEQKILDIAYTYTGGDSQ